MNSHSSSSSSLSMTQNDKTDNQSYDKENEIFSPFSLDHIDIDDTEFDIPLVNPPTLESILNAPDYEDSEDFQNISDRFLVQFFFVFLMTSKGRIKMQHFIIFYSL